jgi:membrane-associated HD superfamily phosphohydrolase
MEIESIRPILSGLLGGLLAIFFCNALSRWIPQICNGKSAEILIRENRVAIWLANALLFGGLIASIAIIQTGLLLNDDWRSAGLGAGGGCIAALAVLAAMALVTGHSPKEAYVAYAISQRTPMALLYGILVVGVVSFVVAGASVITELRL